MCHVTRESVGTVYVLDLLLLPVDFLIHHQNARVDVDGARRTEVEVGAVEPPFRQLIGNK